MRAASISSCCAGAAMRWSASSGPSPSVRVARWSWTTPTTAGRTMGRSSRPTSASSRGSAPSPFARRRTSCAARSSTGAAARFRTTASASGSAGRSSTPRGPRAGRRAARPSPSSTTSCERASRTTARPTRVRARPSPRHGRSGTAPSTTELPSATPTSPTRRLGRLARSPSVAVPSASSSRWRRWSMDMSGSIAGARRAWQSSRGCGTSCRRRPTRRA